MYLYDFNSSYRLILCCKNGIINNNFIKWNVETFISTVSMGKRKTRAIGWKRIYHDFFQHRKLTDFSLFVPIFFPFTLQFLDTHEIIIKAIEYIEVWNCSATKQNMLFSIGFNVVKMTHTKYTKNISNMFVRYSHVRKYIYVRCQ